MLNGIKLRGLTNKIDPMKAPHESEVCVTYTVADNPVLEVGGLVIPPPNYANTMVMGRISIRWRIQYDAPFVLLQWAGIYRCFHGPS